MIPKYTGWEMYPLEDSHRNDGHVYVRWADVEWLREALGRITRLDTARADFGLACAQDIAAQQHEPEQQPAREQP